MLTKFKLSTQLNIGFGSILVLLIIISFFAYQSFNKGYDNFTAYRELARDTNLAGRIQANMLKTRLSAIKYINDNNPVFLEDYNTRLKKMEELLSVAKKEIQNPQRAKNISDSIKLVKDYKAGFENVVRLINKRNEIVFQSLDPSGLAMRQAMTEILTFANRNNFSSKDIYTIAKAEESLLLGRLYVVKFLVTNSEEDYNRAKKELRENLVKTRDNLTNILSSNSSGKDMLAKFDTQFNNYVKALDGVHDTIEKRNDIIDNTLNKAGPIIASKIESVKLSVKKEQDILGPQVQKEAENSVFMVTIVSLVSIILGLIMAWYLARTIRKPIGGEPQTIANITSAVSSGDLTHNFGNIDNSTGIYHSVAEMTSSLRQLIRKVVSVSDNISEGASQVLDVSENAQSVAAEQQSRTAQIATAVSEMSYSIQEVVKHAANSATEAKEAIDKSSDGKAIVDDTIAAIQKLAERVEQSVEVIKSLEKNSVEIGSVIEVIKGISEQTNLLALNAAIEAARAGEQGRGFAVVADEVRGLAQSTREATSEIQEMIQSLQAGTAEAVSAMDMSRNEAQETVEKSIATGEALDTILETINNINDMNTQVATAVEEQSVVAEDINVNIAAIDSSASAGVEGASNTADYSRELSAQATQLKELIGGFKV